MSLVQNQKVRFVHAADLHLGNKQYNNLERYKDFNRAFKWLLNFTKQQNADFLLISGDIFATGYINPEIIYYIYSELKDFKEQTNGKCPVIMIEGNHDLRRYGDLRSWLQFLAKTSLIILLDAEFDEKNNIIFKPYDYDKSQGGYINIKGINVYGLRFRGLNVKDLFNQIYEKVDNNGFNILMMHFGIYGYINRSDAIQYDENLDKLKEKVNYLALGHFHKHYIEHKWIFNPGSTESNEYIEAANDFNRGVLVVDVDLSTKKFEYKFEDIKKHNRKFIIFKENIGLSELNTYDKVKNYLLNKLDQVLIPKSQSIIDPSDLTLPVLYIILEGTVNYSTNEININDLILEIQNKYNVLLVKVRNLCQSPLDNIYLEDYDNFNSDDIETNILQQKFNNDNIFRNVTDNLIPLVKKIKEGVLEGYNSINDLLDEIESWWDKNEMEKYYILDNEASVDSKNKDQIINESTSQPKKVKSIKSKSKLKNLTDFV